MERDPPRRSSRARRPLKHGDCVYGDDEEGEAGAAAAAAPSKKRRTAAAADADAAASAAASAAAELTLSALSCAMSTLAGMVDLGDLAAFGASWWVRAGGRRGGGRRFAACDRSCVRHSITRACSLLPAATRRAQ